MHFVVEFTWLALYLIIILTLFSLEQISECLERANDAKQYVMWLPPRRPNFLLFGWNILAIIGYIFIIYLNYMVRLKDTFFFHVNLQLLLIHFRAEQLLFFEFDPVVTPGGQIYLWQGERVLLPFFLNLFYEI